MKTIEEAFAPYNFSKNRCYVFVVTIKAVGYTKIEHKLPNYVQKLKGIFISTDYDYNSTLNFIGIASFNFNGQALQAFHIPVKQTLFLFDTSHPVQLHNTVLPNSFIQGYYEDLTNQKVFPYTLHIYLHYEP